MAEDEEPQVPAQLIAPIISNAELDQLIADLGANALAKGEPRQVRQGVYVSLKQSGPEGFRYGILPERQRTTVLFLQEGRVNCLYSTCSVDSQTACFRA
jgi:hypothetical protein